VSQRVGYDPDTVHVAQPPEDIVADECCWIANISSSSFDCDGR
jgi:hypothetical protein